MQFIFITIGLIASFLCLSQACPSETVEQRLSHLEKQSEIQQREIVFLYAQINYPCEKQVKEPKELKESVKAYGKKGK
jgi:hypothetical protein